VYGNICCFVVPKEALVSSVRIRLYASGGSNQLMSQNFGILFYMWYAKRITLYEINKKR
jgi:hypothetical protein